MSNIDFPPTEVDVSRVNEDKARNGRNFERHVIQTITQQLSGLTDLRVLTGHDALADETLSKHLTVRLPNGAFEHGDIDGVIARGAVPLVIISCKVSVGERMMNVCGWAQLQEKQNHVKTILVVSDSGRNDFGKEIKPSISRNLSNSFLWHTYFFRGWGQSPRYVGGNIFWLDELPSHIVELMKTA
jgi:hypothetical protein